MPQQLVPLKTKPTVILIERNPLVAKVLRRALRPPTSCKILRTSNAPGHICDVASVFVIDHSGPTEAVYGSLRDIAKRFPDSKRVLLGEKFEVEILFAMLHEGVHGFMTYLRAPQQINQCIASVIDGHLWLSRAQLEQVCIYMQTCADANRHVQSHFTGRQKQIIELVQRRLSNKEIASELHISENTVKFHLAKVFVKAGAHGRESLNNLVTSINENAVSAC